MEKIVIAINPDGTVEADYNGFKGTACQEKAQDIKGFLRRIGIGYTDEKLVVKDNGSKRPMVLASNGD